MIQFLVCDITAEMGHLLGLRPLFWKKQDKSLHIAFIKQSLPFEVMYIEIGCNINVAKPKRKTHIKGKVMVNSLSIYFSDQFGLLMKKKFWKMIDS